MLEALPDDAGFGRFGLPELLMKSLEKARYTEPTPIQTKTIPLLLAGHDIIGQSQTGTGKTAAFALPLLAKMKLREKTPRVLVLAPTRELAVQVATAFAKYGEFIAGLRVAAVYGGADMRAQLRALARGAHVVVGTPGRVMDHMRRGTLKLASLEALVLDEADEMLRMGFIEDVEWILSETSAGRQIALFSATMPLAIRRIAERYLHDPREVLVETHTTAAVTIRQRVCRVAAPQKLAALTRILDAEAIKRALIFVRTRAESNELAQKLTSLGYACAPLNGDIAQGQREATVGRLKSGKLALIIATDVAARGLHVDGISHVINYDAAGDVETYVHRIGRTGRAGQAGEAILFVGPREGRILREITRVTRAKLLDMPIPSVRAVNELRAKRFKDRVRERAAGGQLELYEKLIGELESEHGISPRTAAAALASMLQGKEPLARAKSLATGDLSCV